MTAVERLQRNGILRLGSKQRGFRYRGADGGRPSRADLERIRALRIPPAWREVAIASSPRASIQAVGRDAAGRWQYRYHERAVTLREKRKARRLRAFIRGLPLLRQRVARDLSLAGGGVDGALACVLRVLSTCFLRPGSERYASENGSYGISTLRRKHVEIRGSRVYLRFVGKGGKKQEHELHDAQVARVLGALLRLPGARVFRVRDGDGELRDLTRGDINAYIRTVMGEGFSAKDFRTWAGTLACACALADGGFAGDDSPAQIRRKIAAAVKQTATTLGNTPAISRSSYISPLLLEAYAKGRVLAQPLANIATLARYRGAKLHPCEQALLRLLENGHERRAGRGRSPNRLAA